MHKRILTGIKPTGTPHIGNYLGAIKPALSMMNDDTECFFFIADFHALTTVQNAKELKKNIYEVACTWLACGLDPDKSIFYRQSSICEIFELYSILSNFTPKGLMNRAHAYKANTQRNIENGQDVDYNINMGLYNYPILMAADILLFNIDYVPVGLDQKQHIEIARDIAQSFNNRFTCKLKLPQELISKGVETLPGLDGRKMSKSYNNVIPLFASEKTLKKLINSIVTDSTLPSEPKSTDSNVFQLYKLFATKKEVDDFTQLFASGISWSDAKQELFRVINRELSPLREKYNYYMNNLKTVDNILEDGSNKARRIAEKKMTKVRKTIGL